MNFIENTENSCTTGLWTARQAASFIKCSVSYIYKAAERGALPCIRIGRMLRFDPQTVRGFTMTATAAQG